MVDLASFSTQWSLRRLAITSATDSSAAGRAGSSRFDCQAFITFSSPYTLRRPTKAAHIARPTLARFRTTFWRRPGTCATHSFHEDAA